MKSLDVGLAIMLVFCCACHSAPDSSGWHLNEPEPTPQEQRDASSNDPTGLPVSEPVRTVPGDRFDWAPDDVQIYFHSRQSGVEESLAWDHLYSGERKWHLASPRYELRLLAPLASTVSNDERGVPASQVDNEKYDDVVSGRDAPTWYGLGGPFLNEGVLHLFECTDEMTYWVTVDYVVSCYQHWGLWVYFGAGEEPKYATQVATERLPEWFRTFYRPMHVELADDLANYVTVPDREEVILLDFYVYQDGDAAKMELQFWYEPMLHHIRWRIFSFPNAIDYF